MRHLLRQLGQLMLGGATPKVGAGLLTFSATLASALWVSVSVPNMPLLRGLDNGAGTSVAISLQSALLGIDDGKSRTVSPRSLARELGLSDRAAKLFASGGVLPTGTAGRDSLSTAGPLVLQLAPSVSADLAIEANRSIAEQRLTSVPGQATGPADGTLPAASPPPPAVPAGAPVAAPIATHAPPPAVEATPPPAKPALPVPPAAPALPPKGDTAPPGTGGASAPAQDDSPLPSSQSPGGGSSQSPGGGSSQSQGGGSSQSQGGGSSQSQGGGSSQSQGGGSSPAPDTTPPVIHARADLVAEASGPSGATVSYASPAAADAVDGAVAVSCAPAPGSTFALGSTTVTCTATDASGNSAHSSFDVLVRDTIAPTIQAHVDLSVEATAPSGAAVSYAPPAGSDAVDGAVSVSCAPASGSVFGFGHTTVTCSAHDAAGNAATHTTFDVLVHDTTAPLLQAHGDVLAEATGPSGATVSYGAPTASDAVDGTDSVACAPASGTAFALGHTTVACTSSDAAGNVGHSSFDVIVEDTTAPIIQVPADMTAQAPSNAGVAVSFSATSTDAVDGTDPVTCSPASGTTFAPGTTLVTCSAHDAAGNQAAGQTFNVIVTTTQSHSDAVHSLLDVDNVLKGFGLSHAVEHDLHGRLIDTATAANGGDQAATCQAFDGFTTAANAQLTSGQLSTLAPSVASARTTLGC